MISILSFIGVSLILILEGRALAIICGIKRDDALSWTLGYPIGALLNALLFFVLHLLGIGFGVVSVVGGHVLALAILILLSRRIGKNNRDDGQEVANDGVTSASRIIFAITILILATILLTTMITVTTFPMFYWDSFAHWGLRAKESLAAGYFLTEGIIMPQYPVLFHSLHMVHALIPGWCDQLVNSGTFMISLSAYTSMFLIIKQKSDKPCALITVTLLLSIPLVTIHFRQSMADIHVTAYVLLSALLLDRALIDRNKAFLLLSAVFVAAAAWTKFEGLYFGLIPWLFIVGVNAIRHKKFKEPVIFGALPAIAIPWHLYVLVNGMRISPHGRSFSFHPEAIPHILEQLFALGTFGMHWWAIVIVFVSVIWMERKNIIRFLLDHPSLMFALITFLMLLAVYLFTDEVRGLVRRDNFSRAMMLPALLFTSALALECCKRSRGQ